jgi:EAL domain-containing protein (putative c-di-GMP-specific phosphodiesterase class I)
MEMLVSATKVPGYPRSLADVGTIDIALQPIIDVSTGSVIGAEALARFPALDSWPVDEIFNLARVGGWGGDLEAACLHSALSLRGELPAEMFLTVNASPNALSHPLVRAALERDLTGIILEITENEASSPDELSRVLRTVREHGGQIAIDDASSGYAGLLRLSQMRPDLVKLDRALVTGARGNDVQIVVIEALVSLCRRIGARILGEGVETLDDLRMLGELDVDYAQGWAIARPVTRMPLRLPEIEGTCRTARRALMRIPTRAERHEPGTNAVTAALADSTQPEDVRAALLAATIDLGVDVISLSTLSDDGYLHEVTATGREIDLGRYALADYPATRDSLDTATMVEAHVNDPYSDAAERALLIEDGLASLLLTPVLRDGSALGILEFSSREHHPWTRRDIQRARTVAEHLASALVRMRDV